MSVVFARFDAFKIQSTVNHVVKDLFLSPVVAIINSEPFFAVLCELYRVLGMCIETYAKKL